MRKTVKAFKTKAGLMLQARFAGSMVAAVMLAGCATSALWDAKLYSPASAPTLTISPRAEGILVHYDEKCSDSRAIFNPTPMKNDHPPDDVLATGQKKQTSQTQPRAYWLFASTNTVRHQPPEFVDVPSSTDWVSIPVVPLDMKQPITNRADFLWLRRDPRAAPAATSQATKSFARKGTKSPHSIPAGTNALGQQLYITNAVPEQSYYWKLSSSPPRYISITSPPPEHGYYAASYGDKLQLWHDGKEAGVFPLPTYGTYGRATVWRVALTPIAFCADVALVGTLLAVGLAACAL